MARFKMKGIDWKDPAEATSAAEKKKNTNFKYDPAVVNTDKQTVSIHGTKTTPGKVVSTYENKMSSDKWKEYLKNETPEQYAKRIKREIKDGKRLPSKTETHDINESWDGLDLDLGDGEIPPPPEINVPVDPSGMDPDGVDTDAVNTKLGDLDDKLEGRKSNLTKRKEESTALDAEGFDSEGTPLKTRGIANKDWGLA